MEGVPHTRATCALRILDELGFRRVTVVFRDADLRAQGKRRLRR